MFVLVAGDGVYLAEGNHVINSEDAEGGSTQEFLYFFVFSNYSLELCIPSILQSCL
jgi:hypothetical protein